MPGRASAAILTSRTVSRCGVACTVRRGRRRGRMPRLVYAAATGSWVTITRTARGRARCVGELETSAPECESRLPVGSSAKTMRGRLARARATATRCCWPPESLVGLVVQPVPQVHRVDDPVVPGAVGLASGDGQRQQDVLPAVDDAGCRTGRRSRSRRAQRVQRLVLHRERGPARRSARIAVGALAQARRSSA